MKEIEIKNSTHKALIDDFNFDYINSFIWELNYWGYAVRYDYSGQKRKCIFMHREILKLTDSNLVTDHINHDKLDNRKENLRVCTKLENNKNMKKRADKKYSSKYKGVYWCAHVNRWRVQIVLDGKRIFLGYYELEVHGALAYNEMAIKYHGEFASLNNIPVEYKYDTPIRFSKKKK